MKKRILNLILVLAITLSLLMTAAMAKGTQDFADVKETDWFYDAVCYVTDNSLMNGTGSAFSPQQPTSRAMLWTVLSRVGGQNAKNRPNDWYAAAQLWAVRNDISDGTAPETPITREQLASMLYRYAQRKGLVRAAAYADLSAFADAASVSTYANEAMQWAVANGILTGMGGRLCPQGSATRAQVAQILYRLCETWDLLARDNTAAIAAAIRFADESEHTHSWGEATPAGKGTHTCSCACGETKTEYCTLVRDGTRWKCSVCGFIVEGETDAGVSSWDELQTAISDRKNPIYLANDFETSGTITILEDTTIYGCGHALTLTESSTSGTMIDAGGHALTLEAMELNGNSNQYSDLEGVLNCGANGSLILNSVAIQNFKAERILRAVGSAQAQATVSLTNVTIRDNKLKTGGNSSFLILLTDAENASMKHVSITGNTGDNNLIGIWNRTKLEAEDLKIEKNQVSKHILGTSGTMSTDSITLTSGSIQDNQSNDNGIYMVGNLTIGKDMTVECDIALNNDSSNGKCTLTNDGTIIGDISSPAFTWKPSRGKPIYTGTGTHSGQLINFDTDTSE